jgi:hypothetical protein
MQHYVAMDQGSARQQGIALNRSKALTDDLFTRMAVAEIDEAIHSYFLAVYRWAPFWCPMLKTAIELGSPTVNRICSLAIVYGCMGKELRAQTLLTKSQALYAEALRQVQPLIEQPDKTALAQLVPPILMLAMYNVSFLLKVEFGVLLLTDESGL